MCQCECEHVSVKVCASVHTDSVESEHCSVLRRCGEGMAPTCQCGHRGINSPETRGLRSLQNADKPTNIILFWVILSQRGI